MAVPGNTLPTQHLHDVVEMLGRLPPERGSEVEDFIEILSSRERGLIKPSVIKPVVFTAEKTLVRKTLGTLGETDPEAWRASVDCILAK